MANHHILTKRVEHGELVPQLISGGVTYAISIDGTKISLRGDAAGMAAQLALVATVETAHQPSTITEVTLTAPPHVKKFIEECEAAASTTINCVETPSSYPGPVVISHNTLTSGEQTNLATAATDHDASTIPSLAVDTASQVIDADGVATGTVTITDSRGNSANGKTIKIKLPPGSGADIDADSLVLAGMGQATANFQTTTTFTGELEFEAYYANGEADPVTFKVRRGTA